MKNSLSQSQEQKQLQLQHFTQQQIMQIRLLELSVAELEHNIEVTLDENPALEVSTPSAGNDADYATAQDNDEQEDIDFTPARDNERQENINEALENMERDDAMPDSSAQFYAADYEEMVYGNNVSFYDRLKEQMAEMELDELETDIMDYLIGSLDNDGLLRKDLSSIIDEMAIYNNMYVDMDEVEEVLAKLQTFDPAGIGGRSLQECLLLQIKRKPKGRLRDYMQKVIEEYFEEFKKKHWHRIASALSLNEAQCDTLQEELRKLNPKPGGALGETEGINQQQVTPDFIVETLDDGTVTFTINENNIPELCISDSFLDMVNTYNKQKDSLSKREREAFLYARDKVEKGNWYIEALRQRYTTMMLTMQAIIDWQKKFFIDGDEADLRPMILKDIADKTGLDISTVSRVSNRKYAETRWGIFSLRFFFTDGYTTKDGEEMSTRKIKLALKELISKENKKKPLSDELLTKEMTKQGFPIARRTIAKYREQLGIPVARLRKE